MVRDGTAPHYLPSGHLLYLSQGTLFAVRFDADALQTIGDPVPLVTDVKTTLQGQVRVGTFSMTDDGTLVYRRETGRAGTGRARSGRARRFD